MSFSREYMEVLFHQLRSVKRIEDLACLLQTETLLLMRLRFDKPYVVFHIKKPSGKERLIEAPAQELKSLLRKLNNYLQSAYFFARSSAAYGFVQQPRNAAVKRNILTNARLHCGKHFLLNIDLKDFFHQVTKTRVTAVFHNPPLSLSFELSCFLAELTTYNDRLPMGSPTSPALSNFATRALDEELLTFCRSYHITYSRYVDDLSFSTHTGMSAKTYYSIQDIIGKQGFRMNMEKIKWMDEADEKIVTGLVLKKKPEVPQLFLQQLEQDVERFRHIMEFSVVTHNGTSKEWVQYFKEYLQGKIRFLQMVQGHRHPDVQRMNDLFSNACNTRSFEESFSWSNFPYC